jgi:hypothetical protein
MKDDGSQQEDVTGLFRKFGGDAGAYKEFAPQEIPASATPVAAPPAKIARPLKAVSAILPATPEAPAAADPLPTAAAPASTDATAAPSALESLFARLEARPAVPAPVAARGLMAHWRKPT